LVTGVQFGVHQDPQGLFYQATFQLGGPRHALVHGVVPPLVQDSALPIVDLHQVPVSLVLRPVKNPLNGSTTLWRINHSSSFGVISKLAAGTLCPIIDPWGTQLVTSLQ